MFKYISKSLEETKNLGKIFAKYVNKGDVIVLNGDLGAGKTAFVSGVMSFYGLESDVSSPTFTIVNEHVVNDDLSIYHLDVYRLEDEDEFYAIGGNEYFENGISFIEWGNIIQNALPKQNLEIRITKDETDNDIRIFEFVPHGEHYENIVSELSKGVSI